MNRQALDEDLAVLSRNKDRWARLPLREKIRLLAEIRARTVATAERQVEAAARAKGLPPRSPLVGEEWLAGPVVQARICRLLGESLEQVDREGAPRLAEGSVRTRPDGQVVVEVFPQSLVDKITFGGFRAEVWMQREVTPRSLRAQMASFYRQRDPAGKVALVLGAGNVASIGPLDMIYKLFVEGQVALLKLNPVNDYLGPFVEEVFGALIREGYVRTAYGGADVGAYLCEHEAVDEIHVTGSDRTHDAIVFGPGEEGEARKRRDAPRLEKRVTSELGNVSPVVVVPGPWEQRDLRFHAENVASQLANNGGFNCNAAKVLVLHDRWPQKRAFLDTLRAVLATIPQRRAYYPGAEARYQRFVEAHADKAEPIGPAAAGVLPWTLIPGVDPEAADDPCFTTEAFCGVLAETELPGDGPADFLRNAVSFCNDRLWGTLNACLIVHPRTAAALGPGLEQAIADLRYGSVTVNHWAALSYALGVTPWGAYPGHTRDDIQSGVGVVHNTLMFDTPEKSVIHGPFRVWPRPPWFVTNRTTDRTARRMLQLEAEPSLARLPGVVLSALRG